ncbi:MAG: uroporphyrinogen-III synthase [Myxococcales bacterium]|nr:MAG: uroporphyrinogen-III synthase [Myxococcales bacterium]
MAGKELEDLKVVSLESRRQGDMATLLRKRGAEVLEAPSMRELPLADQSEAHAFATKLLNDEVDVLVLLTGVGLRMLVDAMSSVVDRGAILRKIEQCTLLCRGPKPVAVLKEYGIKPALVAREPNTWRELLEDIERSDISLQDRRVVLQEYGRSNVELVAGLKAMGALLEVIQVYAWQLPEDTKPLEQAIVTIAKREADAVLFTSARQVDHLFQVAEKLGEAEAMKKALCDDLLVLSVGPICSEALKERGLPVDLEPEHPKMGHLVKSFAERGKATLERKRGRTKV